MRRSPTGCVGSLGILALASFSHLGPGTVPVDRADYATAIADSWDAMPVGKTPFVRSLLPAQ